MCDFHETGHYKIAEFSIAEHYHDGTDFIRCSQDKAEPIYRCHLEWKEGSGII